MKLRFKSASVTGLALAATLIGGTAYAGPVVHQDTNCRGYTANGLYPNSIAMDPCIYETGALPEIAIQGDVHISSPDGTISVTVQLGYWQGSNWYEVASGSASGSGFFTVYTNTVEPPANGATYSSRSWFNLSGTTYGYAESKIGTYSF